ncbi:MAG: ATP-dependent 6-phosphofructokinase [Solirubrobacterales bacterium]|nr:ATP-dependent 6-phosphofructokinase [Solirubrobacterales bacterium]HMT03962.1 ATP-dependent 6-phosphofructokinase [Solirubrobacterales bacterium]
MKIGMLTGGGDCPGLNAVIRAAVLKGSREYGHEFVGYLDGWKGAIENLTTDLGVAQVQGILSRGGTILGSSRTNPAAIDDGLETVIRNVRGAGIDGLIAIGGDDTLGVARLLTDNGLGVVGVPKTIDNDLNATDYTFGFDTAVNIVMESLDRLRTTGSSHHRALVVEVMGRHAGWIALHGGMAGGADLILIPEEKFTLEAVCRQVDASFRAGVAPLIVASEGAIPEEGSEVTATDDTDAFGNIRLGGIAGWLADRIEQETGHETRSVVLGHLQRGGTPTAFDRVLATRLGYRAIEAVTSGDWGMMTTLRGTSVDLAPLADAVDESKTVPLERLREAENAYPG